MSHPKEVGEILRQLDAMLARFKNSQEKFDVRGRRLAQEVQQFIDSYGTSAPRVLTKS